VLPPIAESAIWSHVGEVRADRTGKQKLVWDWAVCAVTLREAPQNRLLGVRRSIMSTTCLTSCDGDRVFHPSNCRHSIWRQHLAFVTDRRRIAHGLMQTATADITLHGAHRSLAPYSASGKSFFFTKYLLCTYVSLVGSN